MQFVSLMPKLDKEVAIKIIEQFPNYASMATNLLNMCNNVLENSKFMKKEVINMYLKQSE